jgi:integrase
MSKKRTNITLDPEVFKKARELGINISQTSQRALKQRITHVQQGNPPAQQYTSTSQVSTIPQTPTAQPTQTFEPQQYSDPDEFLNEFEQTCRVDWGQADSTVKEKMRYAEKLVNHLDGHPLTASKQQLREFVSQYDDHNATKTVRVIYRRYFDTDIADSFKVQPPTPKPKKVPKKDELQQVYNGLDSDPDQVAFLLLATSGMRRRELIELTPGDLDPEDRAIYPSTEDGQATKQQWVTFYNAEVEDRLLATYDLQAMAQDETFLDCSGRTLTRHIREASEEAGTMKITPQVLRVWFCNEMNRLGVADRYIDAFCGRTPKSVLAKHYSDFTPRKLQEIYETAGLSILT